MFRIQTDEVESFCMMREMILIGNWIKAYEMICIRPKKQRDDIKMNQGFRYYSSKSLQCFSSQNKFG